MHPSQIKTIRAKIYGGEGAGGSVVVTPKNIADVAMFFKDSQHFLKTSESRMLEITLINQEGLQELRRMYARAKPAPVAHFSDDPFERNYKR